jgi:phytoene dehydrogenase-like protein
MSRTEVVVIGAGHNGLTAAALLAKEGRKVLILERRSIVGGLAAGEEFHAGFRSAGLLHDTTGLRPEVVATLELERHGLTLTPEPPAVFAPERRGRGLLLGHSAERTAAEIGSFSPRDAERYREYRAFLRRVSSVTDRLFTEAPPDLTEDGWGGRWRLAMRGIALRRLGHRDLTELLRLIPMAVADWLREWFETELLGGLLAGPAILGSFVGPYSPGTGANLLRWEAAAGRAATRGPQSVIDALQASARSQGVEVRTEARVRAIRVSGGRVQGVTLDDGEEIDAPIVASSCDPRQVFLQLVSSSHLPLKLEHRISKYRMNGTSAKVNLALSSPLRFSCRPELEPVYARTGETFDEMERAFDAAKYGRFSDATSLFPPPRTRPWRPRAITSSPFSSTLLRTSCARGGTTRLASGSEMQ